MYIYEYLMYVFEDQIGMFGYFKISDIILSLVSSQKLDWTHTFDTHCMYLDGLSMFCGLVIIACAQLSFCG